MKKSEVLAFDACILMTITTKWSFFFYVQCLQVVEYPFNVVHGKRCLRNQAGDISYRASYAWRVTTSPSLASFSVHGMNELRIVFTSPLLQKMSSNVRIEGYRWGTVEESGKATLIGVQCQKRLAHASWLCHGFSQLSISLVHCGRRRDHRHRQHLVFSTSSWWLFLL